MKTGSKILLGISGAALLVAGSVAGTLAYLTSRSEVVNTFTMGSVGIDLTETKVDAVGNPLVDKDGNPTGERTDDTNNYRLVPGASYTKDPMITVEAGSEDAYVRMMVTIKNWSVVEEVITGAPTSLFGGLDTTNWTANGSVENADGSLTLEYRYADIVDGYDAEGKEAAEDLPMLFTNLLIPGELTSEEVEALEGFEIVIQGHAIQANGFENAKAAWEAFENQENPAE